MTRSRLPLAALLVLVPVALVGGARAGEPVAPPLPPGRGPVPLTLPTAPPPPDDWCATSDDLDEWQRLRALAPGHRAPARSKAANVQVVQGFILMEDDGTLTRNDRLVDLAGRTVELVPVGDGYAIFEQNLAYEAGAETPLFADQRTWGGVGLDLTRFAFPFGGQPRVRIWITSDLALTFDDPPEPPVTDSLCGRGCWLRKSEILANRTPRVSALQHGTQAYGWNAFYREEADRVVFTWRANDGGALDLDVQVVLFADGRIRFNYASVEAIGWGAPTVVTGNDAWWSNRLLAGLGTDPAGDVGVPGPEGAALDVVSIAASQVVDSEVVEVDVTFAAPPPPGPADALTYYVVILDEPDDTEALGTIAFVWDAFGWRWSTQYFQTIGSQLRFHLFLSDLELTDDDLTLQVVTTFGPYPAVPGDDMTLEIGVTPTDESVMLDLSEVTPTVVDGPPIFEAFSLPELLPAAVDQTLREALPLIADRQPLEAVGIYQNFDTDIIFFAGGYATGGNAAADGIGRGTSSDPESTTLLHLNNIYRLSALDWAMTVLSHELSHRWLYFARLDEGGNAVRRLNPVSAHPAGYVHMPAVAPVYRPNDFSFMGGSNWTDNLDGSFTSEPAATGGFTGFTWNELYLMGLADPAEVPDWWYILDPSPAVTDQYWPPPGITVSGTRVPVSLDQIITAEGPRFPAYPDARSDFLAPLVLVTRPGVYNQPEVDTVEFLCDEWQRIWPIATADRSTLRCSFHPPQVDVIDPASNIVVPPGATVAFTGDGWDEDGDGVALSWRLAGLAPDADGPGPYSLTFVNEGFYEVELHGVDTTGMEAAPPATRTVLVRCDTPTPPDEVELLMVRREGDAELRLTWSDLPTGPTDYLVVDSVSAPGPFEALDASAGGGAGLLAPLPAVNTFYRVAARYDPGCLGSL